MAEEENVEEQGEQGGNEPEFLSQEHQQSILDEANAEEQKQAGQSGANPDPPATPAAAPAPVKAPVSWEDQPLPEGHPLAQKYKSMRDFHEAYNASGQEALKLRRIAETLYTERESLTKQVKEFEARQAKPPAPQAKFDLDAFGRDLKDPSRQGEATARFVQFALESNPELAKRFSGPAQELQVRLERLEKEREETQERAVLTSLQQEAEKLQEIYPEAKPGTPENEATQRWIMENGEAVRALTHMKRDGKLKESVALMCFVAANQGIFQAKQKGMENKLGQLRKTTESARPGSGGRVARQAKTQDEVNEELLEAAAADGVTDTTRVARALKEAQIG